MRRSAGERVTPRFLTTLLQFWCYPVSARSASLLVERGSTSANRLSSRLNYGQRNRAQFESACGFIEFQTRLSVTFDQFSIAPFDSFPNLLFPSESQNPATPTEQLCKSGPLGFLDEQNQMGVEYPSQLDEIRCLFVDSTIKISFTFSEKNRWSRIFALLRVLFHFCGRQPAHKRPLEVSFRD